MTINIKVVTTTERIPQLRNIGTAAVCGPLWLLKDGPEPVTTFITLRTGLGVRPNRLWVMVDMARSWSLGALLHLSEESLSTFSDREAWERVGFKRLKSPC